MEKFKNKYRIPSNRLKNWNYASNSAYFITICTQNREHYFGEIINSEMHLNELGRITENEWLKTPTIRPDMNLELGAFVVMPNHFHAVIIIGENKYNIDPKISKKLDGANVDVSGGCRDAMHCVSTNPVNPTNPVTYINTFGPQSKNLASIVRGFKSSVTINSRKINPDFIWQSRYHDHIIRNSKSFENIQKYIEENPLNWKEDKFYNKI